MHTAYCTDPDCEFRWRRPSFEDLESEAVAHETDYGHFVKVEYPMVGNP